jgi:excisionase family DNA binding protein
MTAPASPPDPQAGRDDALLSVAELATYLGVPVATIYRWRHHRQGPVGYRIGRHVRYRTRDIQHWLETQRDPHEATRVGASPPGR